jgi:hypothetical protein
VYIQRKYLPNADGQKVLQGWMNEATGGTKAARWAHISKYHKDAAMGFSFGLSPIGGAINLVVGGPFVAARAALRAIGQQGRVCPLCMLRKGQAVDVGRYLDDKQRAKSHPDQPTAAEPPSPPSAPSLDQPAYVSVPPEFKTCPDCAEHVRSAAVKCRFCGYMFDG